MRSSEPVFRPPPPLDGAGNVEKSHGSADDEEIIEVTVGYDKGNVEDHLRECDTTDMQDRCEEFFQIMEKVYS
ncbi:hypothetical protein RB195_003410 [Necator americanus]|uniref:Uncharacterized protein n=1 Tax=Necator americanus TaxID=51031 RepID=A0ABR1DP77_NECAM